MCIQHLRNYHVLQVTFNYNIMSHFNYNKRPKVELKYFVSLHGRRHNFETGGAELEVGRKMCVHLCAHANF